MRPIGIPDKIKRFNKSKEELLGSINTIVKNFEKLKNNEPLISIVIPAYNEEENILKALFSLSETNTKYPIEIIVVNNNSSDQTENLVISCNVTCITEKKQGIVHARNAGLAVAKGEYLLTADADTIYPADWIDDMVNPLIKNKSISVTYGKFCFIPIGKTTRSFYFFYEYIADLNRYITKYFREEAVNVYGFTCGCRTKQCLDVDGFTFPAGAGEDGWMALKLREKGYGKLYWVTKSRSLVWTTDRRIQIDGVIFKGTLLRIAKNLGFK